MSAANELKRAGEAWRQFRRADTQLQRMANYKNETSGMRADKDRWYRLRLQAQTTLAEIFKESA